MHASFSVQSEGVTFKFILNWFDKGSVPLPKGAPEFPLPLPVRMTAPMANTLQCSSRNKDRETRKGEGGGRRWSRELCHQVLAPHVSKQGECWKGFGLFYPPDWRNIKILNCFVTKVMKILESHAKTTIFSYFTKGNSVAHTVHCNSDQGLLFKLMKSDEIISSSLNNPRHMF